MIDRNGNTIHAEDEIVLIMRDKWDENHYAHIQFRIGRITKVSQFFAYIRYIKDGRELLSTLYPDEEFEILPKNKEERESKYCFC